MLSRLGSLVLPALLGLLAPRVTPDEPRPGTEESLDDFSARLQSARMDFESALALPAEDLDVPDASRRFDEALIDLRWLLETLDERGEAERPGARRLLLESSADELELSWARLHEVAAVTPQVRALARLDVDMRTLLDAGRPRDALQLFEARLPTPMDPLDWPAVVRRRLREVERLAHTARTSASPAAQSEPGQSESAQSEPTQSERARPR